DHDGPALRGRIHPADVLDRPHGLPQLAASPGAGQGLAGKVPLAGPRREQQQDPRSLRAGDRVALAGLEAHQRAGAELEPLVAALDVDAALDARDPRVLLHLVLAELLARREHDEHGSRGVVGVDDEGVPGAARRIHREQVPVLHGRDVPISRVGEPMAAEKFQAPRGTHDVLPSDTRWWATVRAIEEQAALYGYGRIQTPGFEDTGLFARTSGEASDVVHKEMYTFTDRGDRSLTLRPEGTAPIARAYIEHGLSREPQPVKLYTLAPMYRYGRPGRGRYREHWQLSLEAIASADPAVDAGVIQLCAEPLRRLGVTDWELRLNSIGDANCRPQYVARLDEWLDAHPELLADEEIVHKRATSILQVFDVKNERLLAALA